MRLRTRCDLELHLTVDTPLILMLRPRSGASQWVSGEEYTFSSGRSPLRVNVIEYADIFGNLCQRLLAPAGEFKIHTTSMIETADKMDGQPGAPFIGVQDLPEGVLTFLVPSRYCESDRMGELARQIAGSALLGYDQVEKITAWIREHFPYQPGTSAIPLSAIEIKEQGHGVCRDLAHLGIALCRSISIPSRMVVGYLHGLQPMDLHAWFEVYVGDRWYAFDPSQQDLSAARVAIAYGRDAADVAIFHQFGPLPTYSDMQVSVEQLTD